MKYIELIDQRINDLKIEMRAMDELGKTELALRCEKAIFELRRLKDDIFKGINS